jgi:hypothetical protein
LVFSGATVAICSTVAATIDACTEGQVFFVFDIDAGINGKFVVTDIVRFVEEALVFTGATVTMCHTMAATIDAGAKG